MFKVIPQPQKPGVYSLDVTPTALDCVGLEDGDANGIPESLSTWRAHDHGLTGEERPDIPCSSEADAFENIWITCRQAELIVLEVMCWWDNGLLINCQLERYLGKTIYEGKMEELREHLPRLSFEETIIRRIH